jgi:hypothetical protein
MYVRRLHIQAPDTDSIVRHCAYILRPLCHLPTRHDGHYEKAGPYLFPGGYCHFMGRNLDRMFPCSGRGTSA